MLHIHERGQVLAMRLANELVMFFSVQHKQELFDTGYKYIDKRQGVAENGLSICLSSR